MEARSLFVIIVLIIVALVKASVKNTARRGVKTIGKQIEKNGERMAQAQDAPYRPAPPKGAPQRGHFSCPSANSTPQFLQIIRILPVYCIRLSDS